LLRLFSLIAVLCYFSTALAQSYSGTYVTRNDQGGTVTLVLKQDASGKVSGSLSGGGSSFLVEMRPVTDGIIGTATSGAGSLMIAAQVNGAAGLKVMLAEPLGNGQPNMAAARRFEMTRSSGGGTLSQAPAAPKPANPMNPMAPGAGPGQGQAQAGQDGRLAQFLMGNAWCGFTYNQTTGTSRTERVVFHGNGVMTQTSGAQTYSSGAAGSVAGQYGGGNQGRWKVQNGMLLLSQDGAQWNPQQLQITRNSNGSPIVKSGGKEYMVCN